jgi:hypothetical protein
MDLAEKYERGACTVEIFYDPEPESPREWCNLGTMVHWHRRSNIGDEDIRHLSDEYALEDLPDYFKRERGATVVLPVYLYEHSGQTVNTTGFSCPWDSGQVGFIFDTPEGREQCGTPPELIEDVLRSEVEDFDRYLRGEVYGYVVERDGEHVDSCWGFHGDLDYVKSEANSVADHETKNATDLGAYEAAH